MIRVTFMDGTSEEMEREGILGVYSCANLFRHCHLKADALFYHHGKLYPVLGPLPEKGMPAWILLFDTHGQVIAELPAFSEDKTQNAQESDGDFLLKSA